MPKRLLLIKKLLIWLADLGRKTKERLNKNMKKIFYPNNMTCEEKTKTCSNTIASSYKKRFNQML